MVWFFGKPGPGPAIMSRGSIGSLDSASTTIGFTRLPELVLNIRMGSFPSLKHHFSPNASIFFQVAPHPPVELSVESEYYVRCQAIVGSRQSDVRHTGTRAGSVGSTSHPIHLGIWQFGTDYRQMFFFSYLPNIDSCIMKRNALVSVSIWNLYLGSDFLACVSSIMEFSAYKDT